MMSEFLEKFSEASKDKGREMIENMKRMVESQERKASMVHTLSDEQLETRRLAKVNPEGTILKLEDSVIPSKKPRQVEWKKGANARFRYKSYTFVPETHEHHHDHCCSHDHKNHDTEPKIVKKLIADSNDDGAPFELRVDMGFSVDMFEKCLKTMVPGEKSSFLVMPIALTNYAHMEKTLRRERKVKTGEATHVHSSSCCGQSALLDEKENPDLAHLEESPLELEIEFVDLMAPGQFQKESWEMSIQEKLVEVPQLRAKAAELYKSKKYQEALKMYERAIVLLESIVLSSIMVEAERELEQKKELKNCTFQQCQLAIHEGVNPKATYEMLQTFRLNYSACQLKLNDYNSVIRQCSEVLKRDSSNVKALFRRAQAYLRIGRDLDLAQKDIEVLKSLLVDTDAELLNEVLAEEKILLVKLKAHEEKEKKMYSNMFS